MKRLLSCIVSSVVVTILAGLPVFGQAATNPENAYTTRSIFDSNTSSEANVSETTDVSANLNTLNSNTTQTMFPMGPVAQNTNTNATVTTSTNPSYAFTFVPADTNRNNTNNNTSVNRTTNTPQSTSANRTVQTGPTLNVVPNNNSTSTSNTLRSRTAAYWEKQNQFGFWRYTTLTAMITNINQSEGALVITLNGKLRRVDARNAVAVSLFEDRAQEIPLSELKTGVKARLVVEKKRTLNKEYRALVIMQVNDVEPVSAQPTIRFLSGSGAQLENSGDISIPVRLSRASDREVSVDYTVTGNSTFLSDHNLKSGTLRIPAGQTTGYITFAFSDDNLDEVNENIVVTLNNPQGNIALGSQSVMTYTIRDNDQPQVRFSQGASSGFENTTSGGIPVTLSATSPHDVVVYYRITGGTAQGNGVDYTLANNGSVTIPAGQMTATIPFTVVDNMSDNANKTITLELYGPVNGSLGDQGTSHTFTITDND